MNTRNHTHTHTHGSPPASISSELLDGVFEYVDASVELLHGNVEGRRQSDHLTLAGRQHQQTTILTRLLDFVDFIGRIKYDANQQPLSSGVLDAPPLDGRQPLSQVPSLALNSAQKLGAADSVHHIVGHRTHEGVAGEGGAVVPRLDGTRHLLRHEDSTDRQAASQWLGESHDVGGHTGVLVPPQLSRAAKATLHLVEHKHRPALITEFPKALQEPNIGRVHPALALYRLHKHRTRVAINRPLGLLQVIPRTERHISTHQRRKGVTDLLL
mmetsp:Transcript_45835/g.113915  ORF Transcript_45835/g.113915 Transcript_45835/m.113915 type:complete len:270 (-) Transcript_45835:744-1553(-)